MSVFKHTYISMCIYAYKSIYARMCANKTRHAARRKQKQAIKHVYIISFIYYTPIHIYRACMQRRSSMCSHMYTFFLVFVFFEPREKNPHAQLIHPKKMLSLPGSSRLVNRSGRDTASTHLYTYIYIYV